MRGQARRRPERERPTLEGSIADLEWGFRLLTRGDRELHAFHDEHALALLRAGAQQLLLASIHLAGMLPAGNDARCQCKRSARGLRQLLRQIENVAVQVFKTFMSDISDVLTRAFASPLKLKWPSRKTACSKLAMAVAHERLGKATDFLANTKRIRHARARGRGSHS